MIESLEITSVIGCRNGCSFCPQSTLVKSYQGDTTELSLEVFEKCLSTVPRWVVIIFAGYAEPLFATAFADMLSFATKNFDRVSVLTTLVGLTEEKAAALAACRPQRIGIHVPDLVGFRYQPFKWIQHHNMFLSLNLPADYMAMSDEIAPVIKQHLAKCAASPNLPKMISRSGLVFDREPLGGDIECGDDRWHSNVLLPNGDVIGCCMGYDLKPMLGNLLRHTHAEIYAAAEQWKHSDHENDGCRRCEWAKNKTSCK